MERVLLIMWFVSLVFVCIIGYREIINAVPYGLEMASKIVSENNGMVGTLYQKILTEAIHCYQIVGALLVMLGGFGIIKSVSTLARSSGATSPSRRTNLSMFSLITRLTYRPFQCPDRLFRYPCPPP